MNKLHYSALGICVLGLSSCMLNDPDLDAPPYQTYDSTILFQQNSVETEVNYRAQEGRVNVPESYHVGQFHMPASFKDRDKTWVSSQNPNGYTIEIADGDKATQVAQKLYQTPKTDRAAQIQYQQQGKVYYRGVYGTYPDAASAQKALDALPAQVKQGAGIKNWSSVQKDLE